MKSTLFLLLILVVFLTTQGCKHSRNELTTTFKMFDKEAAENKFDKDSLKTGKWIEYFTKDFENLSEPKGCTFYRLTEYKKGKPFGKFAYYYKSGKLHIEGYANDVNSKNMIIGFGQYKSYYENGQLMTIYNFSKDGELDKEHIGYYENGDLHFNFFYEKKQLTKGVAYSEDKKVSFKYFPNWANSTNDIDKRVVLFENFETEDDFFGFTKSNHGGSIINGKLFVETKDANLIHFLWNDFKLDKEKDFEISAEIELLESSTVFGQVGILWGTKDENNLHGIIIEPFDDNYIPYKIFNGIKSFQRNQVSNSSMPQLKENIPNAFILLIERNKDNINFKIDGEIIHTILFQDFFGDKLGFIVGNCPVKATFDNLIVKYKRI